MKHTIRKQILIMVLGIMAGTIFLCWLINSTYLIRYYTQNKQQILVSTYEAIEDAAGDGSITESAFATELERLCGINNLSVIVIDADSELVQSAGIDSNGMMLYLLDRVFLDNSSLYDVVTQEDNYVLEISHEQRNGMTYMQMWGTLQNGNLFMIRCVVESIKESTTIANRFLVYVGVFSVLLGSVIIIFVTKRLTDPITSLTEISRRMAHLDFDVHYEGKDKNEIGVLGQQMNVMSHKLESAISELKTANNELQKDIAKKEEIDEMRREFLSNVSHELKTPLALIMGYAEGIKEEIGDDVESRDYYLDVIMDEANKMNVMVKKLLTLNQLESGNDIVEMSRFDLKELLQGYLSNAEILVKQNDITLDCALDDEPYFVWGDEFKVEEVLTNFFSNAINHAAGKKRIQITLERRGEVIRTRVFNTGAQIPEESLPHLFEKFYKVDKARTREYGGSGVGLSIVKAIMDSFHQAYGVSNHPDGVEFWFELAAK